MSTEPSDKKSGPSFSGSLFSICYQPFAISHSLTSLRNIQPVPHSSDRFQKPGFARVFCDGMPQPAHVDIQRTGISGVFGIPDILEQLLPFQDRAMIVH